MALLLSLQFELGFHSSLFLRLSVTFSNLELMVLIVEVLTGSTLILVFCHTKHAFPALGLGNGLIPPARIPIPLNTFLSC